MKLRKTLVNLRLHLRTRRKLVVQEDDVNVGGHGIGNVASLTQTFKLILIQTYCGCVS